MALGVWAFWSSTPAGRRFLGLNAISRSRMSILGVSPLNHTKSYKISSKYISLKPQWLLPQSLQFASSPFSLFYGLNSGILSTTPCSQGLTVLSSPIAPASKLLSTGDTKLATFCATSSTPGPASTVTISIFSSPSIL